MLRTFIKEMNPGEEYLIIASQKDPECMNKYRDVLRLHELERLGLSGDTPLERDRLRCWKLLQQLGNATKPENDILILTFPITITKTKQWKRLMSDISALWPSHLSLLGSNVWRDLSSWLSRDMCFNPVIWDGDLSPDGKHITAYKFIMHSQQP